MPKASVVACALGATLLMQATYSPARYRAGTVPALPVMALGGGQVFVELAISPEGRVAAVTPLRTTPPFTDLVVASVRDWQFAPAEEDMPSDRATANLPRARAPVPSNVLVAAVFRPPALTGPTLGEIPKDVAAASADVAFPLTTTMPPFPPAAHDSGVVLLEVQVDGNGVVADVAVIRSAPPFDDAARTAARQWRFRPARVRSTPTSTLVYVLFGFPVPVGNPPSVPRARSANPPGTSLSNAVGLRDHADRVSERRLSHADCITTTTIRSRLHGLGSYRRGLARSPRGDGDLCHVAPNTAPRASVVK
ncbi:MAG: TonB family protein [Acidobacteria bacterium]|nr:TonB family protein [Acidobacteriota bacterium]